MTGKLAADPSRLPRPRGARRALATTAAACALILFPALRSPAEEITAARQYRVQAGEMSLDLEHRVIHAQQDATLTYDGIQLRAQAIAVDLREQFASARGEVEVTQGRNVLFAQSVDYDLARRMAVLAAARGEVEGIYFSAQSVQVTPREMILTAGSFTTCDESRPHYQVTAEHILLRPGDCVTARRAALWYGGRRLLTVPQYTHSLSSGQLTSPIAPVGGFSRRDGPFAGLRYSLPTAGTELQARYTVRQGLRACARAGLKGGWGEVAAVVSRRDDLSGPDLDLFAPEVAVSTLTLDRVPEATISLRPLRLGHGGDLSVRGTAGYYREQPTGAHGGRQAMELNLSSRPVALGRGVTARGLLAVRGIRYHERQHRSALAWGLTLDSRPSDNFALGAGYLERRAHGSGPFAFDALELRRELVLGLTARPGVPLGPGWRMEIVARHDLERGSLAGLEAAITRVGHCLEYAATWSKAGGEFGIRIGLARTGPLPAPAIPVGR